ncbi:hypothetical protein PR202_gb14060 [Eleusine coracana subsp. coracana]|uniref:Uncharacterized protein n=1 Tax=Eleusine coracana subsp. coracana TaxID=191504 RepID=A0AAV5EU76_ELECO|nr:hypothetical protein PR202_gb14060 [Eleusine coracana subsp. coracana]
MARGKKRTAAQAACDEPSKTERTKEGRRKRVKAPPRPEAETEYFAEKRNLLIGVLTRRLQFLDTMISSAERHAQMRICGHRTFSVGTEWHNIDKINEFKWNFEHLENALEEGGILYGRTVYLFGCTEPAHLYVNGELKMVDCPFPPSDKLGINSVQREKEEIVSMKTMKMDWVPYVPLEDRLSKLESLKTKIFTLVCTQRRSALKHLNLERVKTFDYCLPFEDGTSIQVVYPPIVCEFDWEMDNYEDFADGKVESEGLPEDEKEKFKAKKTAKKAIDDMDTNTKEAFENIKLYKFYPMKTPDTPDVERVTWCSSRCRFFALPWQLPAAEPFSDPNGSSRGGGGEAQAWMRQQKSSGAATTAEKLELGRWRRSSNSGAAAGGGALQAAKELKRGVNGRAWARHRWRSSSSNTVAEGGVRAHDRRKWMMRGPPAVKWRKKHCCWVMRVHAPFVGRDPDFIQNVRI